MMTASILLVSDDLETGQVLANALEQRSIKVVLVGSAEEALQCWEEQSYDLFIVNAHSPQADNVTAVCRQLRSEGANPILLLTPQDDECHLLEAYWAGVDESIIKPIGLPLFLAKVTAWLHRSWTVAVESLDMLQVANLHLEPDRRQVTTADGSVINLTNLEFRLLHLLMSHPNQVMVKDLIMDLVWGHIIEKDPNVLENIVNRLRHKIEPDPGKPRYIESIGREGYLFRSR